MKKNVMKRKWKSMRENMRKHEKEEHEKKIIQKKEKEQDERKERKLSDSKTATESANFLTNPRFRAKIKETENY